MTKIIKDIQQSGEKKSLLLHCCCAPCASHCLMVLKDYFDITLYFCNPNMDTAKEFYLRAEELSKFVEKIGGNISIIVEEYNHNQFLDKVKGLEDAPEGGARCNVCYALRLSKTAQYAKNNHYDYFASVLSISPHKNASLLNKIGYELQQKYEINYLPNDFKKDGGFLKSTQLSKQFNLYRQNYCGCEFSKR